ncbi:uncharacterized protein LOC125518834 [Triticum urartu]|nr:uncharacterized protein LOC125518834 [Triticum urartu]
MKQALAPKNLDLAAAQKEANKKTALADKKLALVEALEEDNAKLKASLTEDNKEATCLKKDKVALNEKIEGISRKRNDLEAYLGALAKKLFLMLEEETGRVETGLDAVLSPIGDDATMNVLRLESRVANVTSYLARLKVAVSRIDTALWPRAVPQNDLESLMSRVNVVPGRVQEWKKSSAQCGVDVALSLVRVHCKETQEEKLAAIKVANTKRHDFRSFMETFIAAATRIADVIDLDEFVEPDANPTPLFLRPSTHPVPDASLAALVPPSAPHLHCHLRWLLASASASGGWPTPTPRATGRRRREEGDLRPPAGRQQPGGASVHGHSFLTTTTTTGHHPPLTVGVRNAVRVPEDAALPRGALPVRLRPRAGRLLPAPSSQPRPLPPLGGRVRRRHRQPGGAPLEEARLAQFAADWKAVRADKDQGKILTLPVLRSNTGGIILKYNSMQGFMPNPLLSPAHWCKDPKRPIQDVTKDLVGSLFLSRSRRPPRRHPTPASQTTRACRRSCYVKSTTSPCMLTRTPTRSTHR